MAVADDPYTLSADAIKWKIRQDFMLSDGLLFGPITAGFEPEPVEPVDEITMEIAMAMRTSLDELRVAALEWMNDVRAEYNLEALTEFPKGVQGVPSDCVIARGMADMSDGSLPPERCSGRYGGTGATFMRDGDVVSRPIPPMVQAFMRKFDQGAYPELIAE